MQDSDDRNFAEGNDGDIDTDTDDRNGSATIEDAPDHPTAAPVRKRQPTPRGGWTAARRAAFFDRLAATCNASHAARSVGMAQNSAYALRRRDPAFAAAWANALEQGYATLEARLLAHAMGHAGEVNGAGDVIDASDTATPFDPALAIKVLGMRGATAGPRRNRSGPHIQRVPIEQLALSLQRKLDALAKRLKVEL